MTHCRRFEILLPLHFNDGTPVPRETILRTRADLEHDFGAVSVETQVIQGFDRDTASAGDRLLRLYVDVADTPENTGYFYKLKPELEERFQRTEIRITTYP